MDISTLAAADLGAVTELIDDAIDTMGEPAVVAALEKLFDATIGAYNLPQIPDFLEKPLKDLVRRQIAPSVKALHARIHTP